MANLPSMRPQENGPTDVEPGAVLRGASPVRTAAAIAAAAAVFLAVVVLAGVGRLDTSMPSFLADELGPEKAGAPLERAPATGVDVRIHDQGYTVSHWGVSVSVVSEDVGGAQWRRHVHGVTRDTEFGTETIVVNGRKTEAFLTVVERQGERTWRWKLASRLHPRLGRDGAVTFLDPTRHRVTSIAIDPVRILDRDGEDVTPEGLHWGLEESDHGWLLTLDLDDADLPLPYVIDPAVTHRTSATQNNGGGSTTLTITKPAGTADKDLLVAHVTVNNNGTITAPAGWTQVVNANYSFHLRQSVWYKVAGASEPANYTWTFGTSGAAAGGISAFYGIKTSTAPGPLHVADTTPQTANSGTVTATGITTTTANALVLALFSARNNTTFTQATGMTELYEAGASGGLAVATDSMIQVAAGGTGNKTSTLGANSRNSGTQVSFNVDDVAPTGSVTDPSSPLAGTVVLDGSANDADSAVSSVQFQRSPANAGTWTNIAAADTTSPYSASFDTTAVADGLYDLRVVVTDAAANVTNSTIVEDRRVDNTAPSSTTTFPASAGTYNTAGWNAGCGTTGFCGTYSDAGSGVSQVQISIRQGSGNYWNGGSFSGASEVWNTTSIAAGNWSYAFAAGSFPADDGYTIRVRATDAAANVETPSSLTFTIDRDEPETTIDSNPTDPTSSTSASFTFSADEGSSSFECRLDGGAWGTCASPRNYSGLADGSHTFDVRATDLAGNTDTSPDSYTWLVDTAAPATTVTYPTQGGEYNATGWDGGCATAGLCGTYSDGSGSGVAAVEVSIRQGSGNYWDGSGFSSGAEVWNTGALAAGDWSYAFDSSDFPADGGYTVRVRGVDAVANVESPSSRTLTFDTTAPQTTIDSDPADPTSSTSADFDFSSSESGPTFECRLDGGAWNACTSPASYASLADGSHTFDVRATDAAGNTDGSPASFTWLVDTTAPSSTIAFPGAGGEYNAAGWSAGCPTSGTCGTHGDGSGSGVASVEVSIRRGSGNYWDGSGFSSASEVWNAATLAGGTWSYAFDSSDFPADGSYTVRVRATDDVGNAESPSSRTFEYDTTDPSALFAFPAAGGEYSTSGWNAGCATVGFCGAQSDSGTGVARVEVSVKRASDDLYWDGDSFDASGETYFTAMLAGADWTYAFPAANFPADGQYVVHVRATDDAGNTESGPSRTFRIDDTDPGALFTFPAAGGEHSTSGWNAGCPTSGLCGTHSDGGSGVAQVEVSVKRVGADLYWDGDSFDASGETYFTAMLAGADWTYAFPAANFPADGTYTVHVRATDEAGNTEGGQTRTFTFDTTAPQTTLDSSPADPTSSTSADFDFSSSESGSTFECRLDGGAWGACTSPASHTSLPDGSHTFDVRATDAAGNTDGSPASFTWLVDTTAPSSTIAFPGAGGEYNAAGWNAGCPTSGTCGTHGDGSDSGVDQVQVSVRRVSTGLYWDGASFSAAAETFFAASLSGGDWTRAFPASNFPADGDYAVRAFATDEVGNAETPTARTFAFDATDPTGSLTAPTDGATLRGASVAVSSDSADSGSGVASARFERRSAGGGSWTTIDTDTSAPYSVTWDTTALSDGDYDLRVLTTDAAANTFTSAVRTVTVDNTAPSAATLDTLPGAIRNGQELTGSAADATSGIDTLQYLYCAGASCAPSTPIGSSSTGPAYSVTWSGQPADGDVRVLARATDRAGNTLDSAVQDVEIDNTSPTGALTAPADGAVLGGSSVAVSSDSADSGSGVASARFERRPAGGGGWTTIDTDTSAPYSVTWDTTSLSDGDHDLRVLTTDAAGNTFTSPVRTVTVDNTDPSVTITAPTGFVNAGAPDPFTVTASTPDGDVQNVELFSCSTASAGCSGGSWVSLGADPSAPYSASWAVDPDGNRALRAVATDGAGNAGSDVVDVTIDRTSPTGSLTAPADGSFVTGTLAVSSDSADGGSGIDEAEFQRRPAGGGTWTTIDTDTASPYTVGWDTTPLADGDYDLRVITTDDAGNAFTSPVRTVTVDNSAPSAPVVTLSESSPFAHVSGSEIFVNGDETGTYDVEAASSDAHSGIDKIRFPGPTDDSASPYSASYGLSDLAGAQTVTAFNGAGLTASSPFTVTPDTAEPTGGSVDYPDGYDADGDVTIAVDAGTDALSGVAAGSAVLERRTAALADGACDPFAGAWSPVTSPDSVASGLCAQYRYRVSDRVGNEAVYSSTSVVKVDLVDPAAPVLTLDEASPYAHVVGTEIFLNTNESGSYDVAAATSDAVSGIDKVAFPGGVEDTTSPYSAAYDLDDLSGSQTVTAHDAAGNTASDTFTVTPDTAAPSGGSVDYPDGYDADGTVTITVDAGTDALSGVDAASGVLERRTTTLTGGVCGSFVGGWSAVTSPDTVATGICARYRYRVSDRVGNEAIYTLPTSTVKVDLVAPETTIDLAPGDPSSDASPSFEFSSSEPGSTFECRLDGGAWNSCTSPQGYAGLTDGSHTFQVRATDAAGLTDATPASHTWTVDTAAPDTSLDDVPADPSNDDAPSFEFSSGEPGSTFECRLDGGAWAACTNPETVGLLADGSHTFDVRAVDPAGNVDATPASYTWTVDTVAPDSSFSVVPADPTNDTTPTFEFSASEGGSTFECRLDAGAWNPCTSPVTTGALADGSHTFDVRATDPAGNQETPESYTWVVDAGAPSVSIVQPSGFVNAADADPYTVRATSPDGDIASVELFSCSDASAGCSSGSWISLGTDAVAPYEGSWPVDADGNRALRAVATDAASNTGAAVVNVTIDRTVPATTIDSAPADPTSSPNASFAFSASEGGASFECRLDAGSWGACSSPAAYSGLDEGGHTFHVRATDAAGNVDPTPATFGWTIDPTAPETTIDVAPSDPSPSPAPSFEFSSNEPGSTFECRLDGGAWGACASPQGYAGLADGSHTFQVRATDAAGNVDPSPAEHTWTIDATPPGGGLADPGQYLRGTVALSASPTDTGAGVQSVDFQVSPADAGSWTSIGADTTDPYGLDWDTTLLADGLYDLRIVVTDGVGNSSPSAAVEDRLVDNTAPGATMNDPGPNLSGTVALTAGATDAGSGVATVVFERSAAGAGAWTPVSASWNTTSVADGLYDLRVTVTDNAGNSTTSAPVADRRVDNTKPSLTTSTPADGSTLAAAGSLQVVASEDVAGIMGATLDGSPAPAPAVSGNTVTYMQSFPAGPHTLAGELEDLAGNRQPIRVHFTTWSTPTEDYPYVEKNSMAASTMSLRSTSDTATVTVPAGAWTGAPAGDWLVVRIDPQPAAGGSGGFEPAGEILDVTAYWALAGSAVTTFTLPLELEVDNTQANVIPATFEGGVWRPLAEVPGGSLPASWNDGFAFDGTNVRILTRHLSLFTLLEDVQAPTRPGGFKGTVRRGKFSLSWTAARDNSGLISAYRVYANGALLKTVGGSVRTVAMGKLNLTDRRSFQVAAVDEAGNVGAKTGALKVVPKLAKLKLAAAKAALKKRGFKAGKVTYKASSSVPKGRVIRGSASGLRPAGSKIGLTVSRGRSAAHRPVTSAAAPPPPSTLGTGSAATPPPPSGTPAPAPAAATPLVPAPATAVDEPLVQPERGRVLPLVGARADDLSGLRRELGFGLLAAAFSIAVVAVLRARRPAVTDEAADGEQLLFWDQRIVEAIRRFLRLG